MENSKYNIIKKLAEEFVESKKLLGSAQEILVNSAKLNEPKLLIQSLKSLIKSFEIIESLFTKLNYIDEKKKKESEKNLSARKSLNEMLELSNFQSSCETQISGKNKIILISGKKTMEISSEKIKKYIKCLSELQDNLLSNAEK